MLILTRHIDESIIINENITVTVLNISQTQVCLCIAAPKGIPIVREVLLWRAENVEEFYIEMMGRV